MLLTTEEANYIRENYSSMSVMKLRELFNAAFGRDIKRSSFYQICNELGLNKKKQHRYSEEEKKWLRDNAPTLSIIQLAEKFNSIFETDVKTESLYQYCYRCLNISVGTTDGKHKPGQMPWEFGNISKEEWRSRCLDNPKNGFKKGQTPYNKIPIGEERILKNKSHNTTVWVKTTEGRKIKHIYEWEKINGPIPENHVLIFLDGNRTNCDIDNLILVSMSTFSRINQMGLLYCGDEELLKTAILYSDLCNAIKPKR